MRKMLSILLFMNGICYAQSIGSLHNNEKGSVLLRKTCLVGGFLTVPENKVWKINRLLVTDGGQYNIVVMNSVKHEKTYTAKEIINAPFWTAESALLTSDSSVLTYIFEIEEKTQTK